MSSLNSQYVYVYAKPSAVNVNPYTLTIYPLVLSGVQTKTISIFSKSLFDIKNVYLSAADSSVFDGLYYNFYDPFQNSENLHPTNQGFSAILIPAFEYTFNNLAFYIPDEIFYNINQKTETYSTFLDVIVENDAGYGLLSRDSYSYRVSSWSGFTNDQLPCISGIKLVYNQVNS